MCQTTASDRRLAGFAPDMTANKGEWSEIYVFLKLLGEGRLYAADAHLERNPGSYVEILEILREEVADEIRRYVTNSAEGVIDVMVDGNTLATIPAREFLDEADQFYNYLRTAVTVQTEDGRKKGIRITPGLVGFSNRIGVSVIEAPAKTIGHFGDKVDIVLRMRDARTSNISTMGFSVKSHIASPPTLYNVNKTSALLYEIVGMDDDYMERWNTVEQWSRDRKKWTSISRLYNEMGWQARFIRANNPQTAKNLFYIRESMVNLLAWIYKRSLLERYPGNDSFVVLTEQLKEENPLGYPDVNVYEKVIKDFLYAGFSGMTSSRPWDGVEQINGGYIVVKRDGEVLCYHSSDREAFREYLFTQSHIEYVSQKPDKYNWGKIQKDELGRYILRLNGSARFYAAFRDVPPR